MQIIIGLGNPGKKYEKTRHNVGWLALDHILQGREILGESEKFSALIKEVVVLEGGTAGHEKTLFVYPQTFMNDSGKAVSEILSFYKLTPKDILVLHDEVDLPIGTIRFTDNSSGAGHNGVQSIIDVLGTQEFRRIRIGVESRTDKKIPPTEDFVLQPFSEEDLQKIPFENIAARVLMELRPKK